MVLWAKVDITELCDIRRQGGASIGGVMSVSPTENETGAAPETVSPPSESQTTDVNIAESSSAAEGAEQGSLLDAVKAALEPAAEQPPGSIGDRKSVVSGKSVSARVDLGGRRVLKKKNTTHTLN